MSLSIAIVSYNSSKTLAECLESVLSCNPAAEVIVVDNASQDNSSAIVAQFAKVKLLQMNSNLGFSKACNEAAKIATGEDIVFLNPDVLLTSESLGRMQELLHSKAQIGAVGPLSNYAAGWQNLGYYSCPIVEQGNDPSVRQEIQNSLPSSSEEKKVKLLIGFCLLMNKELFLSMGMMDESLPLGMDDLDLSWRLQLLGKELRVATNSFVFHHGQVSFKSSPKAEVEELMQASKINFSQKLIAHYGGASKVPDSWKLWEIDWFQLEEVGEQESEAKVFLLHKNFQANVEQSLQFLQSCKPKPEIVICNLSGEALHYSGEELVWSLDPNLTWGQLLPKLKRWFGEQNLLVLETGWSMPSFHYHEIWKSESIGFGNVSFEGIHNPLQDKLEWSINGVVSEFPLGGAVIPLDQRSEIPFISERIFIKERMSLDFGDVPETSVNLPDNLPEELVPFSNKWQSVGVYSAGQLQRFDGEAVAIESLVGIIYRVTVEDIFSFHKVLKNHKEHGIKGFLFLFDNSEYQSEDGMFSSNGIRLPDLSREISMAGLSLQKVEAYRCEENPLVKKYHNVEMGDDDWNPNELLRSTAEKIKIETEVLATEYHTDILVSVVLLALNKVEYTRKCIESLLKYSKQKVELILVNNGSTDGTQEYFDSIPGAKVIHNAQNLGVSAGWNQGMRIASGEMVLILNNDTIFGPNTLENLVRCAYNHPNVGVVAPVSNQIAGPQWVKDFSYQMESEIPELIDSIQKQHDLESWSFPRIKGFCMLIPQKVIDDIGFFDERFGLGNFEDDDYSLRLHYKGYDLRVANDSFLFHFGSVSFGQANIDWQKQMQKNHALFLEKWAGGRKMIDSIVNVDDQAWDVLSSGNTEQAAKLFLEQLQGTEEDCEAYWGLGKVAVVEGKTKDAFGFYCRSLELRESEDVALDVVSLLEEFYTQEDGRNVLNVMSRKYPALSVFSKALELFQPQTISQNWEEDVEQFINNENFVQAQSLIDTARVQGESGFSVDNLQGILHYYHGEYDQAFHYFNKALENNPTDTDTLINFYDVGLKLNCPERVLDVMEYALSIDSSLDEARRCLEELRYATENKKVRANDLILSREQNLKIENKIREGMLAEARQDIESLLTRDTQNFRAMNNLGLIFWYEDSLEEAYECFKTSVSWNIWYTDAIVNYYDCAHLLNNVAEFEPILNRAISLSPRNRDLLKIRSELLNGRVPDRLEQYNLGTHETQQIQEKIKNASAYIEGGEHDKAVLTFCDVLDIDANNVEALNGVGIVAFYKNNFEDAYKLFLKAVQNKPLDKDSLLNLWDAAQKLKLQEQVKPVLESAVEIDPTLVIVQQCVETYNATQWN